MSIEYSSQVLAPFQPEHEESSAKPPLATEVDLAYPDLSHVIYIPRSVAFPFSNDECSEPYFEQLSVRRHDHEYRAVQNPVALLIGESGLIANLHHIPEPTIVLLDISPDMCVFMQAYVDALRSAASADDWLQKMESYLPETLSDEAYSQIMIWAKSNIDHPLNNDELFHRAQEAAQRKTVINWNGNIRSHIDMKKLSKTLGENDATITFMNLTNVIPYSNGRTGELSAEDWGAALHQLPTTQGMPILATVKEGPGEPIQTGPFFGIDNLVRSTKNTQTAPIVGSRKLLGAVTARQFAQVL